jgi:signal transduction histidine kinase
MREAAANKAEGLERSQISALADATPNGVILTCEQRVSWASERFAEIAGWESPDAYLGAPIGELFVDRGHGLPGPIASQAIDCELRRPDGTTRRVLCRMLQWEPEMDGAVAWVIEDLTPMRDIERELVRVNQECHRKNREIANLRDRLRRERDEREELLAVVSHELRTPVTIISGYNRLLLSEQVGSLNAEQQRFLAESSKACHRLNSFIGNLLEASRVSPDGEVLEITQGRLAPVIDAVVEMLAPLFNDRGLKLLVQIDPNADWARFDRLRLEQIFTNLLGNAIKFSSPGGTIWVTTKPAAKICEGGPERPCVEIRITDQGRGVAMEDRERIFESYIQVGEESSAGGLGLGLSICKRLVESHGGAIWVEDGSEGGSAFTFTLPVSGAPESSYAPVSETVGES